MQSILHVLYYSGKIFDMSKDLYMRSIINSIAIAACLSLISAPFNDTFAGGSKGGGGGSHSSGSSSHSSGSHSSGGGYSKPSSGSSSGGGSTHSPSSSGTHSTTPAPSSNGYSKPSAPNTTPHTPTNQNTQPNAAPAAKPVSPNTDNHTVSKPAPAPHTAPNTALGAANNKTMSQDSLKAYKAERANATKPPQPVHSADVKNNPARSTYQNADQYMNKRTTIVNNYNSTYPGWGSMGYGMSPNYGMWSNSFLTGMIMGYVGTSLLSNSMWMYSHMHEPWYPSYRADIEAQAANNADLRAKLAAMDAEVAKLKAQNAQPQQQNTLPPGVDPALAVAPEIMMANDDHDGMSWWWAPVFFVIGIGAAGFALSLRK